MDCGNIFFRINHNHTTLPYLFFSCQFIADATSGRSDSRYNPVHLPLTLSIPKREKKESKEEKMEVDEEKNEIKTDVKGNVFHHENGLYIT